MVHALRCLRNGAVRALRAVVLALAAVSGAGILLMTAATVADILLRRLCGHPIPGIVDIIQLTAAVTIACALPYTTAVKGHVAVEFLFQRLGYRGRVVVDTLARALGIALFAVLGRACWVRGSHLRRAGELTLTLQIPVFWVFHVLGFCCGVVALVILYNMLHPGREMIKP